jgi:hypothetical protein
MQTPSAQALAQQFPLPWSHYVKLLSVENSDAREFYLDEALRGGWSFRQLDRQVSTQFYERTLLSKNKMKMLVGGTKMKPEDKGLPNKVVAAEYLTALPKAKKLIAELQKTKEKYKKIQPILLEKNGKKNSK